MRSNRTGIFTQFKSGVGSVDAFGRHSASLLPISKKPGPEPHKKQTSCSYGSICRMGSGLQASIPIFQLCKSREYKSVEGITS